MRTDKIHDLAELRNRIQVFRDRVEAGALLAGMLEEFRGSHALVLAIPAGGVPVAMEIATHLGLELEVMPVNKILFPWTTESGFGAVACDGSEWLNTESIRRFSLDADTVRAATEEARAKVRRRLVKFRGARSFPDLAGRTTMLVDDGIAAGSTLRAALLALRGMDAKKIIIATPTAHDSALQALSPLVDVIYCANVRSGPSYAVADAYRHWTDVDEDEVVEILAFLRGRSNCSKQ